jgi:hypothetical protein
LRGAYASLRFWRVVRPARIGVVMNYHDAEHQHSKWSDWQQLKAGEERACFYCAKDPTTKPESATLFRVKSVDGVAFRQFSCPAHAALYGAEKKPARDSE